MINTMKIGKSQARAFSAALCVAVLAAGCGLAGGHGSLQTASKYQAEGKYRSAYIESKKVLRHDKDNGKAWLLLGKATLMLGNSRDALNDLEHARDHDVKKSAWLVPTGRALLATGQYKKLLKTLAVDPSMDAPTTARIQVLRGNAQRGLNQPKEARQSYQAALKARPEDSHALVAMARLAAGTGHADAAKKYVKQALASASDNPDAWATKGDLAFAAHDYSGAGAAYKKALAIPQAQWLPQDAFRARARLADAQTRQGHYDDALGNIKTLEKMSSAQPYPHYLHAMVLYRQGHLDDAVSQLQKVLQSNPDSVSGQLLMGAVQYAKGNDGQAEMYLSNVMGTDPDNAGARKLLALTLYRQGRTNRALATLRPIAPKGASKARLTALLQKATATGAGMPGHMTGAGGVAPAVAASVPQGPLAARFAKVRKALAGGHAAQAIRMLHAMPAKNSSTELAQTTMLVKAHLQNKDADKAVAAAAAYAKKHADDSAAHQLYGTALVAAGKRSEARDEYHKAYKLDSNNLAALMNLGSLDSLEHQYKKAEKQYRRVLEKKPHSAKVLVSLGKVAALQGDNANAIKWLKQAIAADAKSPPAYLDLIRLYGRAGQFDQAVATAHKLARAFPGNAAAMNALGATQLDAGDHGKAVKSLQQAVTLAPENASYRVNLARAQIVNKDSKAARGNLQKVIKEDPEQWQATRLLAFMKLHDHDEAGALALARGLQKSSTTRIAGLVLEGDLYMANKSWNKAARAYRRGLKAHHARPLVIKTFLARSRGGHGNATSVLQHWLDKHGDDAGVRMLLAQYQLDHGKHKRAAAQYRRVLKKHASNVEALNNLAWIYVEQGNPKALALAKHAYSLAPHSNGIKDTYAWALVAAKKPGSALPILQQAAKAAPKVATIQYHLAVAQARTGDRSGARATLAALRKSDSTFPDKDAADKLYAQLADASAK